MAVSRVGDLHMSPTISKSMYANLILFLSPLGFLKLWNLFSLFLHPSPIPFNPSLLHSHHVSRRPLVRHTMDGRERELRGYHRLGYVVQTAVQRPNNDTMEGKMGVVRYIVILTTHPFIWFSHLVESNFFRTFQNHNPFSWKRRLESCSTKKEMRDQVGSWFGVGSIWVDKGHMKRAKCVLLKNHKLIIEKSWTWRYLESVLDSE